MTKQQRISKISEENRKRLYLQSKYLRKTGERVQKIPSAPRVKNPFANEEKIFSLKKEKQEIREEEISRKKEDAAEKKKDRESRAKKFKAGVNRNGQPRLGNRIQDILAILQKENSQ